MLNSQSINLLSVESLATRPILDLAASVWDDHRYECFRHCYRSMRRLDDLVDHRKERPEPISASEQQILSRMLTDWLDSMARQSDETEIASLNDYRERFAIPLWPWEKLVRAMQFDLSHRSFESWLIFRRYTEGAAIAPAAVFIYLTTSDPKSISPQTAREIALPLAMFAYLVHIIRDLRRDLERGLFYIPDGWLERHGLNQVSLQILFSESGEIEDKRFATFLAEYADLVRWYEQRSKLTIARHVELLRPDGLLSLRLVRALYGQIADRLYLAGTAFDPDQLQPSGEEIRGLLQELVRQRREDTAVPIVP